MTDEMAERTVVSVADLRRAALAGMDGASHGFVTPEAQATIAILFDELGLEYPAYGRNGRVEWRRGI